MKQSEKQFIAQLEKQASEQRKLFKTTITPSGFSWLASYLAENPWRIILPLSVFTYIMLWIFIGQAWPEWVLALFGKTP